MEIITSAKNANLKLLKSLGDKKNRDSLNLFLVEGLNICRDIPNDFEIEFFAVDEDKIEKFRPVTDKFSAKVLAVKNPLLDTALDTVNPQGIAAVVKKKQKEFLFPKNNSILLDGVSDAGNVGAVLRTAAAAGFSQVYLLDCADAYSPKSVRASMGGIFKIDCIEVDEGHALDLVKNTNSVALDMGGGENLTKTRPVLLIGGNEARGIRQSVLNAAKSVFSLPMKNEMESLNIAVAMSIAMYLCF